MRLGMFMMPVHPPGREMWSTLAEDTEKSILADQLGFDELWMGEHFTATTEPFPSPLMFLAGLVHQTKRPSPSAPPSLAGAEPLTRRSGRGGSRAPRLLVSKGRFMLGIGPGGLVSDFELFKVTDHAARNRMVVEAVDMIENIWSQDPPYDLKGEFWNIQIKDAIMPELGVGFMPKPYQQPRPPICISLASPNSASARTAAERGWGIISANIIPVYSVASHWATYSKACAERGVAPNGDNWRVSRNVMVASSRMPRPRTAVFWRKALEPLSLHPASAICALNRVGILPILKPRPDTASYDATRRAEFREAILVTECAIYGSSAGDLVPRQADRVPRARRPVRHAADDRHRLGRPERGLGARGDAAPGPRGDAEIPPARHRAGGGVASVETAAGCLHRGHGRA